MEPHLASPVKKRVFLSLGDRGRQLFDALPLSGISALSARTTIADDHWETRAIGAADKRGIRELLSHAEEVSRSDSPDALLEIWSYEPREDDVVSLYLDVRDYAEAERDERLDAATTELKEAMFE